MGRESLEEKIKRMSGYLDDESIARALGIERELVFGIREGVVMKLEGPTCVPKVSPTKYIRTTYRQRVISIARVKGGVGASNLSANFSRYLSEQNTVLLMDRCATLVVDQNLGIKKHKVCSDLLEIFEAELYETENGIDALEIDKNLHYLPVYGGDIRELVFAARKEYDVIIIDLPDLTVVNTDALEVSTTVLVLFSGGHAEAERLLRLNSINKEKILVAHAELSPEGKKLVEDYFEADNYLQLKALKGIVSRKSPEYRGIVELSTILFGNSHREEKKGLLGALFRS
jgi:cellulose biosynthesis protein BcsQ